MTSLKIGDTAPQFEAKDNAGNTIKLSDYAGKKLVLFFYPKASTPGCTNEACDLRDNYQTFLAKGYAILGVSADSAKRQQNWIHKHELPFPLLADDDKAVIEAFNVWGPKKFMGKEYDGIHRLTFLIGLDGKISHVFNKFKTKDHHQVVLDFLKTEN